MFLTTSAFLPHFCVLFLLFTEKHYFVVTEMHPWSQRLTFGLLGYGLLMVTDRNWYVPHNEEAGLDARHLTVNFRLHHALKPLAINTGHRLMREETNPAILWTVCTLREPAV